VIIVDGQEQTVVLDSVVDSVDAARAALSGLSGAVASLDDFGNLIIISDSTGTSSTVRSFPPPRTSP
jgi:hypothetical protein